MREVGDIQIGSIWGIWLVGKQGQDKDLCGIKWIPFENKPTNWAQESNLGHIVTVSNLNNVYKLR